MLKLEQMVITLILRIQSFLKNVKKYISHILCTIHSNLYVIGYEIDSGPIRRDSGFGYNNFKNLRYILLN